MYAEGIILTPFVSIQRNNYNVITKLSWNNVIIL